MEMLRQLTGSRNTRPKILRPGALLGGDGPGQNLSGLILNSTAYSGGLAGDTMLDTLDRARNQVEVSGYKPDAVLMHPD